MTEAPAGRRPGGMTATSTFRSAANWRDRQAAQQLCLKRATPRAKGAVGTSSSAAKWCDRQAAQ